MLGQYLYRELPQVLKLIYPYQMTILIDSNDFSFLMRLHFDVIKLKHPFHKHQW